MTTRTILDPPVVATGLHYTYGRVPVLGGAGLTSWRWAGSPWAAR